jgi:hypothetical protein
MENSVQNQPVKSKRGRKLGSKDKKPRARRKREPKPANGGGHNALLPTPAPVETLPANDLGSRINEEHRLAVQHAGNAIEHALACGRMLLEAKAKVGHGKWTQWLQDNVAFSERSAQAYMRIASNPQRSADLGSIQSALTSLAKPLAKNVLGLPLSEDYDPDYKKKHRVPSISRLSAPHHGSFRFKEDGNGADPEAAAEAQKAKFAKMEEEDNGERATAKVDDLIKTSILMEANLVEVWDAASAEARRELVRQRWDMLELARKEIEAVASVEHDDKVAGAAADYPELPDCLRRTPKDAAAAAPGQEN